MLDYYQKHLCDIRYRGDSLVLYVYKYKHIGKALRSDVGVLP
jgi:hypothetical protein